MSITSGAGGKKLPSLAGQHDSGIQYRRGREGALQQRSKEMDIRNDFLADRARQQIKAWQWRKDNVPFQDPKKADREIRYWQKVLKRAEG